MREEENNIISLMYFRGKNREAAQYEAISFGTPIAFCITVAPFVRPIL
jgi:hypothetical protein